MLDQLAPRMLARIAPRFAPGTALHRLGLAAAEAGQAQQADAWFEAAAEAYRRTLEVGPLARLRVHQMMVRARARGDAAAEAEAMLEIVRALNRLDQLEAMRSPYPLRDAREVLSAWLAEGPMADAASEESERRRAALAA